MISPLAGRFCIPRTAILVTMKVSFYFDPSCPFSWITSRWLLMVAGQRDLSVDWRPFSLALKNDELSGGSESPYADAHVASHRVLRVMLAASSDVSLIDLYTDFGIARHVAEQELDDDLIKDVLTRRSLPIDLLEAANDESYDKELSSHIESATEVVGDDIGVPTIVFHSSDGSRSGYFGPVLKQLPDIDEALKLWDGLSALATSTSFYELKRSGIGSPDVFSTARC